MERVYLDAMAMAYYVEQRDPWFTRLQARLTSHPVRVVVSDLTRMECRVKPLADGNTSLLADFDRAFSAAEVAPLTRAVFDRATRIRAASGFKVKTPDAVHIAAAVEHGCDVFLTNDYDLAPFCDIRTERA